MRCKQSASSWIDCQEAIAINFRSWRKVEEGSIHICGATLLWQIDKQFYYWSVLSSEPVLFVSRNKFVIIELSWRTHYIRSLCRQVTSICSSLFWAEHGNCELDADKIWKWKRIDSVSKPVTSEINSTHRVFRIKFFLLRLHREYF